MQLIAEFRGYDGIIGDELLAVEDAVITGATVVGNRITLWNDDHKIIAHAELRVQGKTALWHLYKGQRGKEIGIATEVSLYV